MHPVYELRMTDRFRAWVGGLRDKVARKQVAARLDRLSAGNPGLRRVLGNGVWELKINAGPGFRVYYRLEGRTVVLLLCGGDKGSQSDDIALAMRISRELERSRDH
jgi:putative addiction module killer protein